MDENQMFENRIEQKQDWTKSFGPKPVGRKGIGQKLGACTRASMCFANSHQSLNNAPLVPPI